MNRSPVPLRTGCLVLIVVLAGCVGGGPGTDSPDGSEDTTSTGDVNGGNSSIQCNGDERPPEFGLPNGSIPSTDGTFTLTASTDRVERGESLTFSLTNIDDERRDTGTKPQYVLQRDRTDGWQTVTVFREPQLGFNATAIPHEPGTGFEWTFSATASGFSTGKYVVCEPLQPGQYRFVYAADRTLSVEFAISDERSG